MKKEVSIDRLNVTHSDEYKAYLSALCRLASGYVSRIRVKFAERAYEKYANETIRSLVLAYGKECEELDKSRLFDFELASEYGAHSENSLSDFCLNKAKSYGDAIWFLFDIDKEG